MNIEASGWNSDALVRAYAQTSELQLHWALALLGKRPLSGGEEVLDFGSGNGRITALLSYFLPRGHITGVDLSRPMIEHAQRCYPPAHFPNLTFCSLSEWRSEQPLDRICGFNVFHLIAEPVAVLTDLRARAKLGGELLLIIPGIGVPSFLQAAVAAYRQHGLPLPRPLQATAVPHPMQAAASAKRCVEAAGWQVTADRTVKRPYLFSTRADCPAWMVGTLSGVWGVPLEVAPALFSTLLEHWIAREPKILQENGAILWNGTYVELEGENPES